jgi:hypothetical protein
MFEFLPKSFSTWTENPLAIYFLIVSGEIGILFSTISLSLTDPNIILFVLFLKVKIYYKLLKSFIIKLKLQTIDKEKQYTQ